MTPKENRAAASGNKRNGRSSPGRLSPPPLPDPLLPRGEEREKRMAPTIAPLRPSGGRGVWGEVGKPASAVVSGIQDGRDNLSRARGCSVARGTFICSQDPSGAGDSGPCHSLPRARPLRLARAVATVVRHGRREPRGIPPIPLIPLISVISLNPAKSRSKFVNFVPRPRRAGRRLRRWRGMRLDLRERRPRRADRRRCRGPGTRPRRPRAWHTPPRVPARRAAALTSTPLNGMLAADTIERGSRKRNLWPWHTTTTTTRLHPTRRCA